jgi:hypothetical protein
VERGTYCGMWNVECGMWNVERGTWNMDMECGIWNMECRLQNMELGMFFCQSIYFCPPSCQRYVHFIHSLHLHSFTHNNKYVHNFHNVIVVTLWGLPYIMYGNKRKHSTCTKWNLELGTWNTERGIWNTQM